MSSTYINYILTEPNKTLINLKTFENDDTIVKPTLDLTLIPELEGPPSKTSKPFNILQYLLTIMNDNNKTEINSIIIYILDKIPSNKYILFSNEKYQNCFLIALEKSLLDSKLSNTFKQIYIKIWEKMDILIYDTDFLYEYLKPVVSREFPKKELQQKINILYTILDLYKNSKEKYVRYKSLMEKNKITVTDNNIPFLDSFFEFIDKSYKDSEEFYLFRVSDKLKLFELCDFLDGTYFISNIKKHKNVSRIHKLKLDESLNINIKNAYYLEINNVKDIKKIIYYKDFDLNMYKYFLTEDYLLEWELYVNSYIFGFKKPIKSKRFIDSSFNVCNDRLEKKLLLSILLEYFSNGNKLDTSLENIKQVCLYLIAIDGDNTANICSINEPHSGLWSPKGDHKNILYYYFKITDDDIRHSIVNKYTIDSQSNLELQIYDYFNEYISKYTDLNSDNDNILMVMIKYLKEIKLKEKDYNKQIIFLIDNCDNLNITNKKGETLINLLQNSDVILKYLLTNPKFNILLLTDFKKLNIDESKIIDYIFEIKNIENNFYNYILYDLYFDTFDLFGIMFVKEYRNYLPFYTNNENSKYIFEYPNINNYQRVFKTEFEEWYYDYFYTRVIETNDKVNQENPLLVAYLKISNNSTDSILKNIFINSNLKQQYDKFQKIIKEKVNNRLIELIRNPYIDINDKIDINNKITDSSIFYEIFKCYNPDLLNSLLSQERWNRDITVDTSDIEVFKYLINYLNILIDKHNEITDINEHYKSYIKIIYPVLSMLYKIIDDDKIKYDNELIFNTIIKSYNILKNTTIRSLSTLFRSKTSKIEDYTTNKEEITYYNEGSGLFNRKIFEKIKNAVSKPFDPTTNKFLCIKYQIITTDTEMKNCKIPEIYDFFNKYSTEYAKHKCDIVHAHIYLDLSDDQKSDNINLSTIIYNKSLKLLNINIDTIFIKPIILPKDKLTQIRNILNKVE